ncbi:hypothetical protein L211DRAFT_773477, partial [Terfezia boudieri ATCC MYA-4762]
DTECVEFFRFTRRELRQILPPPSLDQIIYRNRRQASPEEAFCILLSRLSAKVIFSKLFGKCRTWQSVIFNDVIKHLVTRYVEKLEWDFQHLTYHKLQSYAEYVGARARARGASVWGFVD